MSIPTTCVAHSFLDWCQSRPTSSRIYGADCRNRTYAGYYPGFGLANQRISALPNLRVLPGLGRHSMPGLVRCLAAYAFLGAQQRKGEALLAASLWVFSPKVGGRFPAYPPIRSLLYHVLCKPSTVVVIYFSWLKRTLQNLYDVGAVRHLPINKH